MFLVPEILWSSIGNLIYEFLQSGGDIKLLRTNTLVEGSNHDLYSTVLFIQLVGILGATYFFAKNKARIGTISFWIMAIFIFALDLAVLFSFYFVTFVRISFP